MRSFSWRTYATYKLFALFLKHPYIDIGDVQISIARLREAALLSEESFAEVIEERRARLESFRPLSTVRPNVYLGAINSAADLPALKAQGITHIVYCLPAEYIFFPEDFKYFHANLADCTWQPLTPILENTCRFIDNALSRNEGVLLHCHRGMSRSAALACAWLMHSEGHTFSDALLEVQQKRPVAKPNQGFQQQLSKWVPRSQLQPESGGSVASAATEKRKDLQEPENETAQGKRQR